MYLRVMKGNRVKVYLIIKMRGCEYFVILVLEMYYISIVIWFLNMFCIFNFLLGCYFVKEFLLVIIGIKLYN